MSGDITRVTLNVLNLTNSEYIDSLSDAELGQWMRLFCKSVLLAKECSLPTDEKLLGSYTKLGRILPRVLAAFPIVATEYGDRRRNAVLYTEWVRVCGKSEASRESLSQRKDRQKSSASELNREASTNPGYDRTTNEGRSNNERTTNRTIHNNTEQNNTEQAVNPVSAAMDEIDQERKPTADSNIKSGDPGYFRRGQYGGTSPKDIHRHFARAWARAKNESAVCRFPTKHPAAKTDYWEDLCDTHSADLLVPAFELWIQDHGLFMETQWPISEFMKVAEEYMAKVIPLNTMKQKVTPELIEATNAAATATHKEMFKGYYEAKEEVEPKPAEGDLF